MKNKRGMNSLKNIFIFFFILALLMLAGCNNSNTPSDTLPPGTDPSGIGSAEEALELIRNNSSLKHMPGDSYRSVDTDGFTTADDGVVHTFTNDVMGLEYVFSGSEDVEACSLSSITIFEKGYAIFGVTVGDKTADAELILTSYGFEKEKKDEYYVYSFKGINITLGYKNKNITYITIGK